MYKCRNCNEKIRNKEAPLERIEGYNNKVRVCPFCGEVYEYISETKKIEEKHYQNVIELMNYTNRFSHRYQVEQKRKYYIKRRRLMIFTIEAIIILLFGYILYKFLADISFLIGGGG